MKKNFLAVIFAAVMAVSMFTACGSSEPPVETISDEWATVSSDDMATEEEFAQLAEPEAKFKDLVAQMQTLLDNGDFDNSDGSIQELLDEAQAMIDQLNTTTRANYSHTDIESVLSNLNTGVETYQEILDNMATEEEYAELQEVVAELEDTVNKTSALVEDGSLPDEDGTYKESVDDMLSEVESAKSLPRGSYTHETIEDAIDSYIVVTKNFQEINDLYSTAE